MILKPNQISTHYVFFKRNASTCVGIGYINGVCRINSYISKYTYECLSESIYSLTIPADNMTKDEQNSRWHCESVVNSSYRSSSILLKIASTIHFKLSKYLFCSKNPESRFIYFFFFWCFIISIFTKTTSLSIINKHNFVLLTNWMIITSQTIVPNIK